MKILFIEDNPDFFVPTTGILEEMGHEVTIIRSADRFVDIESTAGNFDIAIIDAMLRLGTKIQQSEAPETGIAIFKRIRSKSPSMPVVFVSALSKGELSKWVKFDATTDYHQKPISSDTTSFSNAIHRVTRK